MKDKSSYKSAGIVSLIGAGIMVLLLISACINTHHYNEYTSAISGLLGFAAGVLFFNGVNALQEYNEWKESQNIESKPDQILKDLQQVIDKHK